MVNWLSLAVPLAYLGVLIGSLATFSSLYRKRKARTSRSLSLAPAGALIPYSLSLAPWETNTVLTTLLLVL